MIGYKTVVSNVCDRTQSAFFANNSPNYSNIFQANYFNVPLDAISSRNTLTNNVALSPVFSSWPAGALSVILKAGLEPSYRDIDPLAQPGSLRLGRPVLQPVNGRITLDIAGVTVEADRLREDDLLDMQVGKP